MLAGVAGGLGDYFNVDPAIFRLAFVALSFFGGSGIGFYILAAIFLPERATGRSFGEGLVRRAGGGRSVVGIAILGIGALIVLSNLNRVGGGLFWAAILIGIGYLMFRNDGRDDGEPATPGGPGPSPYSDTRSPGTHPFGTAPAASTAPTVPMADADASPGRTPPNVAGGAATSTPPTADGAVRLSDVEPQAVPTATQTDFDDPWVVTGPTLPPITPAMYDDTWRPTPLTRPPEPPPPPSFLGRLTVAAALLLIGAVALVDNLTALDLGVTDYVALALVIVGAGLVIGTVRGRAHGLIGLGIALTLVLVATTALPDLPVNGAGERDLAPTTVAELADGYELGAGSLKIDLTDLALDPGTTTKLDAQVGFGELVVVVPPDVALEVDAESGIGRVDVLNRSSEGGGAAINGLTRRGPEGSATLTLDLSTGLGVVDVTRAEVQS